MFVHLDAYIASVVNVTWFTINPISYNSEIDLPEFSITHVKAEYCNGTYRYAITENSYKQGLGLSFLKIEKLIFR